MFGSGLAVSAGLCAALASTCAKLAFSPEVIERICDVLSKYFNSQTLSGICEQMLPLIQVIFFACLFIFNGLMWTLFVKSLQKCKSSAEATITNTASNFFFSAVMGWIVFGESLELLWWIGAGFILTGLVFIYHSNPHENKSS